MQKFQSRVSAMPYEIGLKHGRMGVRPSRTMKAYDPAYGRGYMMGNVIRYAKNALEVTVVCASFAFATYVTLTTF